MKIPFCKTTLGEEEKKAISDVIDSGWVVMGEKTREFEEKFAGYIGSKYAVFVDSGTAALFLALQYLKKEKRWDVFRVPSLTFTSTAEVVKNIGGFPIFHDIGKDFCLKDVDDATIPVHLTGVRAKDGAKIYDSAHRIMRDDVRGSDALWCYSFYATKNITTVNGGMIATNDKVAYEWLKKARDHGITQGTEERYKQGKWQYDIEFVGWRLKADDVRAAIGLEQLKKLDWINENRQRVVSRYNALLGLQRTGLHLYPILVRNRAEFIDFMAKNGIQTSVHFLPLHKMTAYKDYPRGDLSNTEYLGERLVSLPLFPQMTNEEVDYVVEKANETKLIIYE